MSPSGVNVCLSSLFACFLIVLPTTTAQKNEFEKVFVTLDALPEPFSNDKLPTRTSSKQGAQERCYNLIGCFETVPVTSLPKSPQDIETEFRIYDNKGHESLVKVGRYENCLQSKSGDCNRYAFNLQALQESPFNPKRRTIVVIGGYFSKAPSAWEVRVKDLWIKLEDVNVIIVGWANGNSGLYGTAAFNTRPVARHLTVLFYYLAKLYQYDLSDEAFAEKIYIVGHSLGAHIAGFVGQDLAGQLGRITGLEPAGPLFDKMPQEFRLDKSDAQLVDVMHTNAGSSLFTLHTQYGSALDSGHIDLYANDGKHQPSCTEDLSGCSHKKANAYYETLLNHALSMRDYLKCGDCLPYRLRAYASDSYDQFHNGTCLQERCPITVLDNDDLDYADLDKCSIPIDYVSWFDSLKEELQTKHGVDFGATNSEAQSDTTKRYFFYTSLNTDDQTDHYLLKLRLVKSASLSEEKAANLAGCDFQLHIEMANSLHNRYSISNYNPIELKDHYDIIVPFLSPNIVTKYELAKLDSNDFYLGQDRNDDSKYDKMLTSLGKVLPLSVKVTGLSSDLAQENKKSLTSSVFGYMKQSLKRLVNMAKDEESEANQSNKKMSTDPRCRLPIESLVVQPLRKIRRHLAAFYSPKKLEKPKVVIRKQGESSPTVDLIEAAAKSLAEQQKKKNPPPLSNKRTTTTTTTTSINPKEEENKSFDQLYMHSVILGPLDPDFDSKFATARVDDSSEENSDEEGGDETEAHDGSGARSKSKRSPLNPHASMLSTKTWLALAVSSCVMVILMALISIIITWKPNYRTYDDQCLLIMEPQPSKLSGVC